MLRTRLCVVHTIHATRKLLDRVKRSADEPMEPTTFFGTGTPTPCCGDRRSLALFVNESTLLPVFVELAPAKSVVADRRVRRARLAIPRPCLAPDTASPVGRHYRIAGAGGRRTPPLAAMAPGGAALVG